PKLKPAGIEEKDCPDTTNTVVQQGAPRGDAAIPCHEVMGGMGRGLHGKAVDLTDIASYVENWSDRPVVDKTGFRGLFAIDTEDWTPMTSMPPREVTGGKDEGPERSGTAHAVHDPGSAGTEAGTTESSRAGVYHRARGKLSEN